MFRIRLVTTQQKEIRRFDNKIYFSDNSFSIHFTTVNYYSVKAVATNITFATLSAPGINTRSTLVILDPGLDAYYVYTYV